MRIQEIHPEAIKIVFETFGSEDPIDKNLLIALQNITPEGDNQAVVSMVLNHVPGVANERVEELTHAFAYLFMCFESLFDRPLSVGQYVDFLSSKALETCDGLSQEVLSTARAGLENFFNAKTNFGMAIKANGLLTHNERNFGRIRIVSDLRPMFDSDDPPDEPDAFLVAHTMKITYQKGATSENIFIGLDTEELLEVRCCIDRAIKKTQRLKDFAKRVGAAIIEVDASSKIEG